MLFRSRFSDALVIAVGRKAELALGSVGLAFYAAVRHPANGGATAFAEGVAQAYTRLVSAG